MRWLSTTAFSLLLLPTTGCINLDLANGEANVFEAQIDAKNTGFRKKNIKFEQIITIDPANDEGRVGAFVVDEINFENLSIEFQYLLEDMLRLEDLLEAGNVDPRGNIADPTVFQVGDTRLQPFLVGMFVTFTEKEKVLDEGVILKNRLRERRVRSVRSAPAFCNFIDPNGELCFQFDVSVLGVNIGRVGGVGIDNNNDGVLSPDEVETTTSATFNDLIVVDEEEFQDIFQAALEDTGAPPNAEELAEAILLRIARDKPGTASIFDANLAEDFR